MKAIISTTYSDKYLFMLPIVTWAWNKLGVDVLCFVPDRIGNNEENLNDLRKAELVTKTMQRTIDMMYSIAIFKAPKHKEATYAQCSRLFAASLDLPEEEQLVVSDIDMLFFSKDYIQPSRNGIIDVYGADLVPPNQFPMCYLSGNVKTWRELIEYPKTYQQRLDDLVGVIECTDFKGNQWSLDQNSIWNMITKSKTVSYTPHNRAKEGTQFSTRRVDRDDSFFMDRLNPDIVDYHCHRPAFEDDNFEKMMSVIKYFYPNDDLSWMKDFQEQYKQLL